MCKHKHRQDRYIARAGHVQILYKGYEHSTHCAMVQAQYVRASTSTGKIGTLPLLVMPKHYTKGTSTLHTVHWYKHSTVQGVQAKYTLCNGTSTVRTCKHKRGQDRYIARTGHAKTLYKRYKHSTHCAMVQAQYVSASTSTGKIGTSPVLPTPKHCILYNARIHVLTTSGTTLGLHMPTAVHTYIHIQDTLLALSKPNTVPHVHTQKCSAQAPV